MFSPTPLPGPSVTRTLAETLLALSGVAGQLRTLPDSHPAVLAGLAGLERSLEGLLQERELIAVEVGGVQLLIEGMETNADYEPLRDLALELRDAGVGALIFRRGVTMQELREVLGLLVRPGRGEGPLPATPHITLRPLRPSGPHSPDPWLALERLVLDDPTRTRAGRDPAELAVGLELHPASAGFDGRVLELLAQVALRNDPVHDDAVTLDALLAAIPAATLKRLFAPDGTASAQREFLVAATPLLGPRTLLRLCQALAPGRDGLVSVGALRVLARLAEGAAPHSFPARVLAEEFLRLVALAYDQKPAAPPRLAPEPERVLKLALESGILEAGALDAADRMIARRQVAALVALLDTVPREDPVARALRARLFHPQTVRVLLQSAPMDLESLDRLIPAAGIEAAPALLDALAEHRERRVRLRLLELLARYGTAVAPFAVERLEGMPWYVQRNLLALLGKLPDLPPDFSVESMLAHRDPRVKHEAIVLGLADPGLRDKVLAEALESHFEPTLRAGLAALSAGSPPEFMPRVLACVGDLGLDPEVRALAVTALAPVKDPMVLRILRRMVVARGIAGLGRLAPRTPQMLAALRGLAQHWHSHPKVGPLLETARQSRDADIREAARPPLRRSSGTTTPRAVS